MRGACARILTGVVLATVPLPVPAQEGDQATSYFRDVRPVLQARCQGCHQPAKSEGDVILTSYADLVGGADDAPIVVPGKPDHSLLVEVITPLDGRAPEMPEDGEPLAPEELELIRRWIAEGAVDDTPEAIGTSASAGPPVYARPPVVTALDYSPDGALLAVSGRGEVLLHDADGSELLARLVGLSERIEAVAFSPDGARLAVSGGSPARLGELQVWDVGSHELLLSLPVTFDTIHGVSWSGDGQRLAFGCNDNTVRAVDAGTGEQVLYQGAHTDWVLGTAWSTDDSHVVSVSRDRSLKLIKVASQQFIDNITSITPGALKGGLMSVERHPSRDELLVGGADGVPKIYRMYREEKRKIGDDYNLIRACDPMSGRVFSTAWSRDGERIVAGSSLRGAGEVRVYRAEDGESVWGRPLSCGVYAVDYHPREPRVAAAGFDGVVRLFDARDGRVIHEFVPVPIAEPEPATAVEAAARRVPTNEGVNQ